MDDSPSWLLIFCLFAGLWIGFSATMLWFLPFVLDFLGCDPSFRGCAASFSFYHMNIDVIKSFLGIFYVVF